MWAGHNNHSFTSVSRTEQPVTDDKELLNVSLVSTASWPSETQRSSTYTSFVTSRILIPPGSHLRICQAEFDFAIKVLWDGSSKHSCKVSSASQISIQWQEKHVGPAKWIQRWCDAVKAESTVCFMRTQRRKLGAERCEESPAPHTEGKFRSKWVWNVTGLCGNAWLDELWGKRTLLGVTLWISLNFPDEKLSQAQTSGRVSTEEHQSRGWKWMIEMYKKNSVGHVHVIVRLLSHQACDEVFDVLKIKFTFIYQMYRWVFMVDLDCGFH